MSRLRFDGQGAGLGKRMGGDANSPTDYTVICKCGVDLGPLARWQERDGFRQCTCGRCYQTTIVQGTQIAGVIPPAAMIEMIQKKAARDAARAAENARLVQEDAAARARRGG